MTGIIGEKIGMTRVFDADGGQIPVTVLIAGPCHVLQRKTRARDGYEALQLGYGVQKEHRVTRARKKHCERAKAPPARAISEIRVADDCAIRAGDRLTVDQCFSEGGWVDVSGVTKGKGFAGVMRRHRMGGGVTTHGGHSKRRPGSIGNSATPARVQKGKAMPGHMGHRKVKQRNLRVVKVDPKQNILLVRGAVPGSNGSIVFIREALKKARQSS